MDRCTADAIAHTTGVKLGRRSLKFKDYGIMAATFHNLATDGAAFRVISTEESRDLIFNSTPPNWPGTGSRRSRPTKGCRKAVLFRVQQVSDRSGP